MSNNMEKCETANEITVLPRIAHELITIGLADLEKAEKDPGLFIDMDWYFHTPGTKITDISQIAQGIADEQCCVCWAGAVMDGTLHAPRDLSFYPEDFRENSDQLGALDSFRGGCISRPVARLHEPRILTDQEESALRLLNDTVTPYGENREQFKSDMIRIRDRLKELNL